MTKLPKKNEFQEKEKLSRSRLVKPFATDGNNGEQIKVKPRKRFELKGRMLRSRPSSNFNKVQQLLEAVDGIVICDDSS